MAAFTNGGSRQITINYDFPSGATLTARTTDTRVTDRLREPLRCPNEAEREGCLPNVVYTYGALSH